MELLVSQLFCVRTSSEVQEEEWVVLVDLVISLTSNSFLMIATHKVLNPVNHDKDVSD